MGTNVLGGKRPLYLRKKRAMEGELRTAITSGKQRNSKEDPLRSCQHEDRETNS
jgi:hypothetical protein